MYIKFRLRQNYSVLLRGFRMVVIPWVEEPGRGGAFWGLVMFCFLIWVLVTQSCAFMTHTLFCVPIILK